VWEVIADGNEIVTRHGYIDGKVTETRKEVKGKNLGRANETTAEEQCISECQSKWNKKIDEQYTEDKDNIKDYADQDILLPMLAHKWEDRKHNIAFPCYVQPKLNGVRCIFQKGKFMSRGGKEYKTLDHLRDELNKLGVEIPDGEIYIHGLPLQRIVSRVKDHKGPDTLALEYWIYDQVNDKVFKERTEEVNRLFAKYSAGATYPSHLVYVDTEMINSEEELKQWHDKWVQQGFEGAIVRNAEGLYKVKHRSKDLQKYKEFEDAEFKITGGHEGTGTDKGTVVFEVVTKEGKPFSVRPKGTRELRAEYLKELPNLIGKELTVRYQELSEDGIPIFPVGIVIRDYE